MKPTITNTTASKRHADVLRTATSRTNFPKIDRNYQARDLADFKGRCFGKHSDGMPFREISARYFRNEERLSFRTEAALFGMIVLISTVPLINSVYAAVHLIRAFAGL